MTELVGIIFHDMPKDGFIEAFKEDPLSAIKKFS